MSLQDAYKPNMSKATKLFGDAAGTVKKAAKFVIQKASTPRDQTEGGTVKIERAGNQLIKVKTAKKVNPK